MEMLHGPYAASRGSLSDGISTRGEYPIPKA